MTFPMANFADKKHRQFFHKTVMRRLQSTAISCALILGAINMAHAASFTYGGIIYNITGETSCEVGRQTPETVSGIVEVPSAAIDPADGKSYEVTSVAGFAFVTCSSLTGITIPATVSTVGNSSFSKCTSLQSVRFLGAPISVGSNCFSESTGITAVYTPDMQSWISTDFNGASASPLYYGATLCSNEGEPIQTDVIPDGVKRIGNYSLSNLNTLGHIKLPASLEELGKGAFEGCPITSVEIPSLAVWCRISFGNYTANPLYGGGADLIIDGTPLTALEIPEGVTTINNYAFMNYKFPTSISVPESVTTIGIQSFAGCTGATTLTLGPGLEQIGMNAFQNIGFSTVVSLAVTPPRLGSKAFSNATFSGASLVIPQGTLDLYRNASIWKNFKNVSEDSTSGMEEISGDGILPARYFNLKGVETAHPSEGIYIRQRGGQTDKIIIRQNQ